MTKVDFLLVFSFTLFVAVVFEATYQESTIKLTNQQIRSISSQTNLKTIEMMERIGCDTVVAERMNTGVWTDARCADKYKHMELD